MSRRLLLAGASLPALAAAAFSQIRPIAFEGSPLSAPAAFAAQTPSAFATSAALAEPVPAASAAPAIAALPIVADPVAAQAVAAAPAAARAIPAVPADAARPAAAKGDANNLGWMFDGAAGEPSEPRAPDLIARRLQEIRSYSLQKYGLKSLPRHFYLAGVAGEFYAAKVSPDVVAKFADLLKMSPDIGHPDFVAVLLAQQKALVDPEGKFTEEDFIRQFKDIRNDPAFKNIPDSEDMAGVYRFYTVRLPGYRAAIIVNPAISAGKLISDLSETVRRIWPTDSLGYDPYSDLAQVDHQFLVAGILVSLGVPPQEAHRTWKAIGAEISRLGIHEFAGYFEGGIMTYEILEMVTAMTYPQGWVIGRFLR